MANAINSFQRLLVMDNKNIAISVKPVSFTPFTFLCLFSLLSHYGRKDDLLQSSMLKLELEWLHCGPSGTRKRPCLFFPGISFHPLSDNNQLNVFLVHCAGVWNQKKCHDQKGIAFPTGYVSLWSLTSILMSFCYRPCVYWAVITRWKMKLEWWFVILGTPWWLAQM